MSILVDVADIPETAARFSPTAFFLTTRDDLRPHAVHVAVRFDDGLLFVPAGRRTRENVEARPLVSLVWAPANDDGYTFIVDGEARADGDTITIKPTGGVLHRPAV
jgi:hypothetical protein